MEISIKQELSKTYLIAEEKGFYRPDFRFRMLLSNKIKGLLACSENNIDDRIRIYFDITGKTSLKDYCEENGIRSELIRQIVTELLVLEEECSEYMMNMDNISLDPERVFVENNSVFFCCFPWKCKEIKSSFHELIIELMDYGDRKDKECMKLLYELHSLTRQNYDLDEVIRTISGVDDRSTERGPERNDIDEEISEEEYFYREPESSINKEFYRKPLEDERVLEPLSRFEKKRMRAERREERRRLSEQLKRSKRSWLFRDDEYNEDIYDDCHMVQYDDGYDERFAPDYKNNSIGHCNF